MYGFSLLLCSTLAFQARSAGSGDEPPWQTEREEMVKNIEALGDASASIIGKDGISPAILEAMRKTERHLFIPERQRFLAYQDGPVKIGHEQTISQPFIVALMTELADVHPDGKVLEIGTGSGYQAAILSQLAKKVCTVEIIRSLGEHAAKTLQSLGYGNVEVRIGDGYQGWPECGPYDAIIVTAALSHVPEPLLLQLKPGGRLVMPVGQIYAAQHLTVVEKDTDGQTSTKTIGLVRFVPFTRSD